jgi:hypothetical protein
MSRASFGRWGANLDSENFARALAAVGIWRQAQRVAPPPGSEPRAERGLGDLLSIMLRIGVVWDLPDVPTDAFDAAELAAGWRAAVDLAPRPLRLAVDVPPNQLASLTWLVGELGREAVGLDGVSVRVPFRTGRSHWSWPLRVAVLDRGQSSLRNALAGEPGWLVHDFVEFVEPEGPTSCDLLLVPAALRAGVAQILERRLNAAVILMLSPLTEPWQRTHALVDVLLRDSQAEAIGFVAPGMSVKDWLNNLIWELSHDAGLDVAMLRTARNRGSPPPVLFATSELLEETRLSRVLDRLETRVMAMPETVDAVATNGGGEAGPAVAAEPDRRRLAAEVALARTIGWDHEHDAAATTARLTRSLAMVSREPTPPRFIQAKVHEEDEGTQQALRALRNGKNHLILVRVGVQDADWLSTTEAFPADRLPEQEEHTLDVVLTAPELLSEPQRKQITLPGTGSSSECSFRVRAGAYKGPFDARIIVLYEGRILQTALLKGFVSSIPESVEDSDVLRMETEAAVRSFDDLSGRTRFDAAFVLNRNRKGVKRITLLAGEYADVRRPDDFDKEIDHIRKRLEKLVAAEPPKQPSLRDESTRELLVYLALHGHVLRDLLTEIGGAVILAAERLQILAATPESFFPLEFVYDGASPDDDAKLCPNAEQALAAGSCLGCASAHDASIVCPMGFWGLRKVIERHVHDPDAAAEVDHDYRVDASPARGRTRLHKITSAQFAASEQVDGFKSGTRAALAKQIERAIGTPTKRTLTWKQWVLDVDTADPPLLILLPHTETNAADLASLFIEDTQELSVARIDHTYVGDGGPIVLLLGCNTGDPTIPFQKFPAAFRRYGAAIVLATLTTVLGRHASVVAGEVVEVLTEHREEQATFGEVIRVVRRKLLGAGIPAALALTAYGDADWILGGRSS